MFTGFQFMALFQMVNWITSHSKSKWFSQAINWKKGDLICQEHAPRHGYLWPATPRPWRSVDYLAAPLTPNCQNLRIRLASLSIRISMIKVLWNPNIFQKSHRLDTKMMNLALKRRFHWNLPQTSQNNLLTCCWISVF